MYGKCARSCLQRVIKKGPKNVGWKKLLTARIRIKDKTVNELTILCIMQFVFYLLLLLADVRGWGVISSKQTSSPVSVL